MKPNASLRLRVGLLLAAAFAALACVLPGALLKNAGSAGADQPGAAQTSAPSGQASGGKTAVLPDASAGLADLKTYHALLQIEAAGSLDGQPFRRSTRIEITRAGSGDFDSQVQSTDSKTALRLLGLGGAYYRWSGASPACHGSADPPDEDEVIEPAALLPPLGAASRVGVESVNQVSAVHYRFDQTALPHFKAAVDVTGEAWVAENGGYLLRYTLKVAAPQKLSGKGLEVSQTYTYELTPDSPAIAQPQDCAPVPVELPVLDGATNLNRTGGLVTFDTSAEPRAVIDFYEQKLPALGWKAEAAGPEGVVTVPVFYDFSKGGLRLTVDLSANEDKTTAVALMVVDAAAQAAAAPHPTQTPSKPEKPLPTIDPAKSGLPDKVPLYPGSTNLLEAGGAVMFNSSDSWQDVAAYYRKELKAEGWTAGDEFAQENGVTMMWKQGDTTLVVNVLSADGQTQIVVSQTQ